MTALRLVRVLPRLWPGGRAHRGAAAVASVTALAVPFTEAAGIATLALATDDVLVPGDPGPLVWIAPAAAGIVLMHGAVSFLAARLAAGLGERLVLDLRTRVFASALHAGPGAGAPRSTPRPATPADPGLAAIDALVRPGPAGPLIAVGRIAVCAGVLVVLDWRLGLVAMAVAPPVWLLTARLEDRARRVPRGIRGAHPLDAIAHERLDDAALVQAHNHAAATVEGFRAEARSILDAEGAGAGSRAVRTLLAKLLGLAVVLLATGMGARAVAEGRLSPGGLLAFTTVVVLLRWPVRSLARLAGALPAAAAAAERVADMIEREPVVRDPEYGGELGRAVGGVRLEEVRWAPSASRGPALDGASLEVAPGQMVAIVGADGAARSAMAGILLRFSDVQHGVVRIDGHDVRRLRLRSLRDNVAVVPRDAPLLPGTIRENLALGRPDATDEQVRAAARAAGAEAFIERLPEGWHTVVGRGGRRLSGTQRHLLAVARALLRDAPVVLIDEPGTELDAAARARLREPLRRLVGGRTALVFTDDPHTVRAAHRVVRMSAGRLVEDRAGATP